MRFLVACALTVVFGACTHTVDNPGAYREDKGATIGFPGVMLHPGAKSGLGLTLDIPRTQTLKINSGESGARASSINPSLEESEGARKITREVWRMDTFALLFPSPKSFFFVGLGANLERSRNAYDEHTNGFALTQTRTNVEWTDNSVSVALPLGISVNTKEGITTLASVGPKMRVANNRQFHFDGQDADVDVSARDATLKSFDEDQGQVAFHFLYLVGYSF